MKTQTQKSVHEHPRVVAKQAEIRAVEDRLKLAIEREQAARARLRDRVAVIRSDDVAPEKKKAAKARKLQKLLSGGVESGIDPADELQAALREQQTLREGQIALAAELREIVADVSHEFAVDYLEPRLRDDTIELYEHLARGATVMARIRARTADALRLGYHVSSAYVPDLVPPTAWGLGDPADFGSELARMRRALAQQGWLK